MSKEQVFDEIGNPVIGAQSRYDMTYYTYRQLQRDHIKFECKFVDKFPYDFIGKILINYMSYAQEYFLNRFEEKISDYFKDRHKCNSCDNIANARFSFTKPLILKMGEFRFIDDDNFKKRFFITYILDEFCKLPIYEREKIYFFETYKEIIKGKDEEKILKVTYLNGNTYEVKPYDIVIDNNSLAYYLIGVSRKWRSDEEFKCYPFKLIRIKDCSSIRKELNYKEMESIKNELKKAEEDLKKVGPAYMYEAEKNELITVRLTERGYKNLYLKIISHQRPIPESEPKEIRIADYKYYELAFNCSERQIRNYFFTFGKDAQVISPESLREQFIKEYKESIAQYGEPGYDDMGQK